MSGDLYQDTIEQFFERLDRMIAVLERLTEAIEEEIALANEKEEE